MISIPKIFRIPRIRYFSQWDTRHIATYLINDCIMRQLELAGAAKLRLARNYNSRELPRSTETRTSGVSRDETLICIVYRSSRDAFLASHNAEDCETSFPYLSSIPFFFFFFFFFLDFLQPQISYCTRNFSYYIITSAHIYFCFFFLYFFFILNWSKNIAYHFLKVNSARKIRSFSRRWRGNRPEVNRWENNDKKES